MSLRNGLATTLVALGAAVAVLAGTGSAVAATGPRWRVFTTLGASYGLPDITGGVAVNARLAYVTGTTTEPAQSLLVARWNGTAWGQVHGPAKVSNLPSSDTLESGPVVATGHALWSFPTIYARHNQTLALRRTGGKWTVFALPKAESVDAAAVFGRSDVWAFGDEAPKHPVLGFGPPFAARFNGHSWQRIAMPGVPLAVSALSRSDIWAFGPTRRTAGDFRQHYIAMHWMGSGWRTMRLPRLHGPRGGLAWPADLAVTRSGLWLTEVYHCAHPGCVVPQQLGFVLAHLTRHGWVRVFASKAYEGAGMEPDGHGGLWIQVIGASGPWLYLHDTNGKVIKTQLPGTSAGSATNASLPIPIPGTNSAWATGDTENGGVIFKYSR
jgi:hypothetical protein